jgi:hypothetical protein
MPAEMATVRIRRARVSGCAMKDKAARQELRRRAANVWLVKGGAT